MEGDENNAKAREEKEEVYVESTTQFSSSRHIYVRRLAWFFLCDVVLSDRRIQIGLLVRGCIFRLFATKCDIEDSRVDSGEPLADWSVYTLLLESFVGSVKQDKLQWLSFFGGPYRPCRNGTSQLFFRKISCSSIVHHAFNNCWLLAHPHSACRSPLYLLVATEMVVTSLFCPVVYSFPLSPDRDSDHVRRPSNQRDTVLNQSCEYSKYFCSHV